MSNKVLRESHSVTQVSQSSSVKWFRHDVCDLMLRRYLSNLQASVDNFLTNKEVLDIDITIIIIIIIKKGYVRR